jgi:hypothetical protein
MIHSFSNKHRRFTNEVEEAKEEEEEEEELLLSQACRRSSNSVVEKPLVAEKKTNGRFAQCEVLCSSGSDAVFLSQNSVFCNALNGSVNALCKKLFDVLAANLFAINNTLEFICCMHCCYPDFSSCDKL